MLEPLKASPENKRESLTEKAYRRLKQEILDNSMAPGFQALESEIATRLGMSRTPVREAVIRLQDDGLVEVVPRRGMRVLPMSPHDMKEIYEVLTCVESEAAAMVAARRPSKSELVPLQAATRKMGKALSQGNLEAWAEADQSYHLALLNMCENKRLVQIAFNHFDQAHRVRMFTLRLRELPSQSTREHQEQVLALRSDNPSLVREMYRAHRERAAEELISILKKFHLNNL